jgi:hypothetical protein
MDSYEVSQLYWARQRGEYVSPRPQNYVMECPPQLYDVPVSTYLFNRLLALLLE